MKQIYATLLLAAVALSFTACTPDNDDVFDESAAERLNNAKNKYANLLTSSQYGWAFEYYPTGNADDGALLYALKFRKDGAVEVAGDPTGTHNIQTEVSLWDIILDQGPVISFSTYNTLIHRWADPDPDGEGYLGDYEFSFVTDLTENLDSVVCLRGKKRGLKSRLKMIDEDLTPEQYLLQCDSVVQRFFPTSQRNYSRLVIGDEVYRLDKMKESTPDFYPFGTDPIFTAKKNSYLLAKYNGNYWIRFNKAFTAGEDGAISEKNFILNEATQEFVGENGNARILPPHFATLFGEGLRNGDLTNFRIIKSSIMDETFAKAWNDAEAALKKKNNTLNEMSISTKNSNNGGNITVSIKYKPRTGAAAEMYYKFQLTREDDTVTLAYLEPYNTGAQTVLSNFPECEALLQAVAGTYTVDNPSDVKFHVTSLQLTSTDESGKAFSGALSYPAETSASK